MKTELKPCPFCGGKLRQNMQGAWEDTNEKCILYGFELRDSEKAIRAWNRRTEVTDNGKVGMDIK